MNRRSFLATTTTAALGASASLRADQPLPKPGAPAFKKRIKFGVATYCYWHFRGESMPIEAIVDKAAEMGVEGLDLLHRQMEKDLPEKAPLTAEHRARLQ